jgi:drug/metabolite transporter (DMT)-like permease
VANLKTFWAFAGTAAIWGSTFLFIKLGLAEFKPFTLVAVRTGFATLALAALLPFTLRRRAAFPRHVLLLAVAGVLNPALPYVLITWGQQYVNSAVAGIINATVPLFTLPLAHLALHDERITPASLGGLLMGFVGVVLIFGFGRVAAASPAGLAAGDRPALGLLAMLAAALCYAGSMVFVRRYLRRVPPEVVAGASQGIAFGLTSLCALALESPTLGSISGAAWAVTTWLGVSSGLSYLLFYAVLSRWGTTRTSLVTYLVPLIAVLLGTLVLGEVVSWPALVGALLVVGGIAVINRAPRVQPAHSAQ